MVIVYQKWHLFKYIYILIHFIILVALLVTNFENKIILLTFFSFFIIPLNIFKSNTFVILERELSFKKISYIEVLESVIFALSSLLFAFLGFEVWSLILASILRSFVGLILAKRICNWKFKFQNIKFDLEFKKALVYGFNYHTPSLLNILRIAINPVIIGTLLGANAVGIADRAIYFAGLPLFFLGSVQQKVLFPYFARIQEDIKLTKNHFEKSFYLSAIIDKIAYIPMILFANSIILKFMPQWSAAIPIFYIVIIGNACFGAFSFSIIPLINGLGRSEILAKLSIISVLFTWIFTIPLIKLFGLNGYAYVSLLLWLVGLAPSILLLNKVIENLQISKQFVVTIFSSIFSLLLTYSLFRFFDLNKIFSQLFLTLISITLYLLFLYLLDGKNIIHLISSILKIKSKKLEHQ